MPDYKIIILLAFIAFFMAWLIYRNAKDEKKLVRDLDDEDELEEERDNKETGKRK